MKVKACIECKHYHPQKNTYGEDGWPESYTMQGCFREGGFRQLPSEREPNYILGDSCGPNGDNWEANDLTLRPTYPGWDRVPVQNQNMNLSGIGGRLNATRCVCGAEFGTVHGCTGPRIPEQNTFK